MTQIANQNAAITESGWKRTFIVFTGAFMLLDVGRQRRRWFFNSSSLCDCGQRNQEEMEMAWSWFGNWGSCYCVAKQCCVSNYICPKPYTIFVILCSCMSVNNELDVYWCFSIRYCVHYTSTTSERRSLAHNPYIQITFRRAKWWPHITYGTQQVCLSEKRCTFA